MTRNRMKLCQRLLLLLLATFWVGSAFSQDGPLQVGYVIITDQDNEPGEFDVFATFGERRGSETTQAGVLASQMTTKAMVFASISRSLSRDLGIAIANPGSGAANLTFTLKRDDGSVVETKSVTVTAFRQVSQFVSQLFPTQTEFVGTLMIESTQPVAMVGLRFRGTNFSTLTLASLSASITVPIRQPGVGGAGAYILPQFALGGGWASEIVVVNHGGSTCTLRADFYKQDGTLMTVSLNGETKSSFTKDVQGGGVVTFSPSPSPF